MFLPRPELLSFPLATHMVALCCALASSSRLQAQEFEAVYAKVSHGYVRTKLADGSFRPESYILKEGEYWGGFIADDTIDNSSFGNVARTIAHALFSQRYIPTQDPKTTKLLIVVDWGMTSPSAARPQPNSYLTAQANDEQGATFWGGPAATSAQRFTAQVKNSQAKLAEMTNSQNAAMLGYDLSMDPLARAELQQYRYFVVVKAYDFLLMSAKRKSRLLWEVRFSISERGNEFDKQLTAMALGASRYFGRDSDGLSREAVPEGHVEIGEVKSLSTMPAPDIAALSPDGESVAYLRTVQSELRLAIVGIEHPERQASANIPSLVSQPVRLVWATGGQISVVTSAAESLYFKTDGRSLKLDEAKREHPPSIRAQNTISASAAFGIHDLIDAKFPHRTVLILGSDSAALRFLLLASGGGGPERIFVFDRPSALLYEIHRSEYSQ